jgi:hypothetical protein
MDFLKNERVELDAILAKVGSERFFEYIKDTLEELNRTRNYNRAVEVSETVESEEHNDFNELLDTKMQECIESERQKIIEEQTNVCML